jgi:enamine deaminase RidA (YjgF/YER057c/UK114 family)
MIGRLHPGKRFSLAVIANGIVTTAGITAKDTSGDVQAQTRDVLAQIEGLLADAGSSKSRLLTTNIWLRDIGHFALMNEVWDRWIDPENMPVRATVEAHLADPKLLVEIQVTALA